MMHSVLVNREGVYAVLLHTQRNLRLSYPSSEALLSVNCLTSKEIKLEFEFLFFFFFVCKLIIYCFSFLKGWFENKKKYLLKKQF